MAHAEEQVRGVAVLEELAVQALHDRAGRCRRRAPTPARGGRRAGRTCRSPCRASTACRRTGGSAPRRRSRSGSRRRRRARRPRRSRRPRRPISTASSASESTCVASGGSTIASPGPISAFSNLPKSSGSAGGSRPVSRDVGGVVLAGADDLHARRRRSRLRTLMAISFGVTVLPDPPYTRFLELLELAEEQGFEYGWTYDSHVLWQDGDPAADARRRPHVDDEARPLRHEPGHARADGARERVRDDARALGRPDGDGDRPRRLGAARDRPPAGEDGRVRDVLPDDPRPHERPRGHLERQGAEARVGARPSPRSRCTSRATGRRRSPSRAASPTA